jgi:hypothetical protein
VTHGLSPTMQAALEQLKRAGGVLERRRAGLWMPQGIRSTVGRDDAVATQTLQALEGRGLVRIEWTARPARAELKPEVRQ